MQMLKLIAILRLVGGICLVVFVGSFFINTSTNILPTYFQKNLIEIALAIFSIIVLLLVYRLYINYYLKKKEKEED
jgi:uncharacterized membrane protein